MGIKILQARSLSNQKIGAEKILTLVFFIVVSTRFIYLLRIPEEELVAYLPDDAFYTLSLAKNYQSIGVWTIGDSAQGSGFHILPAIRMLFYYYLSPEIEFKTLWMINSTLSILLITYSFFLFSKFVSSKLSSPLLVTFVMSPWFSIDIIEQTTSLMESDLVILVISFLFISLSNHKLKELQTIFVFASLVAAPLVRIDISLIVAILIILSIMLTPQEYLTGKLKLLVKYASVLVAGIVLNILFYLWHFNSISSSSSKAKFFYSQQDGHDVMRIIWRVLLMFCNYFWQSDLRNLYVALAIFVMFFSYFFTNHIHIKKFKIYTATAAGPTSLVGMIIIYKFNSAGLFSWYNAVLLIPVSATLLLMAEFLSTLNLGNSFRLVVSIHILTYALTIGTKIMSPIWPYHSDVYKVANYLKSEFGSDAKFGSWNTGILSYFSEQKFYNLDGLVNDEILSYLYSSSYDQYLIENGINYVVDPPNIARILNWPKGSSVKEEALDKLLIPVSGNLVDWPSKRVVLYAVRD